ncbi:MAG: hypothetical protein COU25_02640 [Candidatus Levybacteria bacterium CG10_big_fil_rev_8_21_14_0_10_35_13]|nr:MAG: hypothetical protein COU25_02640 [Candidatus Levybacteria bacterium CG10_big_fil_rev_8_21_14_0_10_35_13]
MIDKKILLANNYNEEGIEFANKGDFDKAILSFKKSLSTSPSGNSYYLLGLAFQMKGKLKDALYHYQKAVSLSPNFSMAHNNLGALCLNNNNFEKAIFHFKSAISADPQNSNAHNNLGNAYKHVGKIDETIACYHKALEITPNIPETLNNLGLVYFEKGEINKGAEFVKMAVKASPTYAPAHFHLAIILNKLGNLEEAARSLESYINLVPGNTDALALLGNTYLSLGMLEKSVESFKKSLSIMPNSGEVINDLGNIYKQMGNLKMALECYEKAVVIDPKLGGTYNNIGVIYLNQGDFTKATKFFKKAIKLEPEMASSYYHLGVIQEKQGELELAAKNLKMAAEIEPELKASLPIYLYVLMRECDWEKTKKEASLLDKLFLKELKSEQNLSETPFLSVIRKENPKINYLIAKSKSDQIRKSVGGNFFPFSFKNRLLEKKLRIGYLSNDYSTHATAHLILGLFECHDRLKFEVYTYSYGLDDKSFYRKKVEKDSDKFTDIRNFTYKESAEIIYKDKINILVDLKGHTAESRPEITALKPAPVQVSYLGFPGTTGADFMDYIITDKIVTPPDQAEYYSEKFVYMPDCYQVNDRQRQIWEGNLTRSQFGLPWNEFVFSCFNHSYKIDTETFSAWMNILKKVPQSVLWLFEDNPIAVNNIKAKTKSLGVNPKRIIFSGEMPNPMHLKRLSLSNLGLDTFICNGHTTTSDALWAGLPVLSLQGKHFASRVASSILTSAGLPGLVTKSSKEYEKLAVELATNPKELESLRLTLNSNRLMYPLFDTQKFVKNLEKAYIKMWEVFASGKKPQQISV